MSKITINYEEEGMQLQMVLDAEGVTHYELRQAFENFLRGIGYVFESDLD